MNIITLIRNIFILIFIFGTSGFISAQSNFVPGYIITNEGDTINGLIDFRTNLINQKSCSFRSSEKAPIETFYPGDIHSYRFIEAGKYFVTKDILVGFQDRKVFVEYLVQGMMNLYYYVSRLEGEYFYFEDNGKLVAITKDRDKENDDRYKVNLNNLFADYSKIVERIPTSDFTKRTMVKISRDYHDLTCTPGEECIVFENEYNRMFINFNFIPYIGIISYEYTYNGTHKMIKYIDSNKNVSPSVGLEVDISFPRFAKPLCIVVDMSLTKLDVENLTTSRQYERYYQEYSFDSKFGTLNLGLKYTYPSRTIRPFAMVGYMFTKQFDISSTYIYKISETSSPVVRKDAYMPDKSHKGWSFGLGGEYLLKNDHAIVLGASYNPLKVEGYNHRLLVKGDKIKFFQFRLGYKF